MARVFTTNISDTECIGDSLIKINDNSEELDTRIQELSSYDKTLRTAITPTNTNLTVVNNLTAGNDIISKNNIRIYKSSINAWINFGDRQIVHEEWIFQDHSGYVMPQNRSRTFVFSTGSNQTWTVPVGVNYIYAKLWGAGGAGGTVGGWSYGSTGGGGGHARGLIPVTPGEVLTFIVGRGGPKNPGVQIVYGFGGGMLTNTDNRYGGAGGGGTFVFRNYSDPISPATQPGGTPLIVAGGGGGGGSTYSNTWDDNVPYAYHDGGGGGGLIGMRGHSPARNFTTGGGAGGTQTSPGVGGDETTSPFVDGRAGGYNGNLYQGGTPGSNSYGGGGGGGYRGGGGGAHGTWTMTGGGGGSGFLHPSIIYGEMFTAIGRGTPYAIDPDLIEGQSQVMQYGVNWGLGYGGIYSGAGFNGLLVIYF